MPLNYVNKSVYNTRPRYVFDYLVKIMDIWQNLGNDWKI